jgi:hypothetical protein
LFVALHKATSLDALPISTIAGIWNVAMQHFRGTAISTPESELAGPAGEGDRPLKKNI